MSTKKIENRPTRCGLLRRGDGIWGICCLDNLHRGQHEYFRMTNAVSVALDMEIDAIRVREGIDNSHDQSEPKEKP